MSNKRKRRAVALGVLAAVVAGIVVSKSEAPKITLPDTNWIKDRLPDVALPEWAHIPTIPWWGYALVAVLTVAAVVYIKKRGVSVPGVPFTGEKYAPKGKLRPNYAPKGNIAKLSWGNTFDNAVPAVCGKTGDLYLAGGDGDFGGRRYETAILRCRAGKDPKNKGSWEFFYGGGGKCYGLTVVDGDVIGIKSDAGSMWQGARNWRIRNFSTGEQSGIIDGWFGHSRVGQFSFLNGKTDGTAHVYFLRAVKEKFQEFGGVALHTSISRKKLKHPGSISNSDFKKVSEVSGLVSPRIGSGSHYPYAVQVDVYKPGSGKLLASLGEFVTSRIYRFVGSGPTGKFKKVSSHTGFGGIPRSAAQVYFHVSPGEHYTAGVFTNYLFYFNGSYWVAMSGSFQYDGMYLVEVG